MTNKLRTGVALGALLAGSLSMASVRAYGDGFDHRQHIDHVLLISIDGMHAVDFANCASGISGVNSGAPYCPNLAALAETGVNYVAASTSKPSDSFPGLMAIVTGASPRTMGVYYDVAFDRSLNPPALTTGNGLPGGSCAAGATPPGTTTEYDEGIELDQSKLNGGAPSGDGGTNAINPNYLVRDKYCNPVYPWNFVRTNSVFGVIHSAHGYTAWSDKHASYASVGGPTGTNLETNVDDYYSPEINSNSQNYGTSDIKVAGCNPLPDSAAVAAGDDYTGSFQNIQCYDALKVQAIVNEIDGKNHNATATTQVPEIFGMNFQAVSIGEKLIYQHGALPSGYSKNGGYVDSIGTPTESLFQEIEFVDNSIGKMVSELKKEGLYDSTLIVVTAKHGQSPIDSSRYIRDGSNDPATILSSYLAPSENSAIGPTEDDVALLWLANSANTQAAVAALEAASPALPLSANIAGIGQILSGPSVSIVYNTPGLPPNGDPRTPDIIVTPNIGVTYSNSKKKLAEHGGFSHDDTNVIMLLANPSMRSATISNPVQTAQVAPTILEALGLDPYSLEAVQLEGTQVLPGLRF
ncbi:MAG TPA: alkaline phosphatase family protein [Candidatus Binataceae bacterium]|nr:alkaline phosphatase family protein [Candidatus Binataceae bacterium]